MITREPPAQLHSPTSCEAAESIKPVLGPLCNAVLKCLVAAGRDGRTDEEMQEQIPMPPSTQRPRRIDLMNLNLVVDSGRTRPTRSGRKATVWVAVEQPVAIAERVVVQGRLFGV